MLISNLYTIGVKKLKMLRNYSSYSSGMPAMVSQRFLEEASKQVKPIYAYGLFFVSMDYIAYYLLFHYHDPLEYYSTIMRDEKLFNDEIAKLWANMQEFLDQEKVIVNNVRVYPHVVMIDVGFAESRTKPYIVFTIRFRAPIRMGRNIYENFYESELIEYNYVVYWIFPPGSKILEVNMGSSGEEWDIVRGNILAIYGYRGRKTGGYEKIVFEISKPTVEEEG